MAALSTEPTLCLDGILVHSGSEGIYFADDRHIPFEAFGHFRHWLPLNRPDQMVLVRPNRQPVYFQVVPKDFWYEQEIESADWWTTPFEIIELTSAEGVMDYLPAGRRLAFLGENTAFAADMGFPRYLQNRPELLAYLDYYRGMKTDYEVAQIRESNRLAMEGHRAAQQAFEQGGDEMAIHLAFTGATRMLDHELPYTTIVGLDEKAAILHYQNKRQGTGPGKVLLIDAGCRTHGYCSDITRTYVRDDAHPVFKALLAGVDQLEQSLVAMAKVGLPYSDIHLATHAGVLDLLLKHEIVHGERAQLEEAMISKLFFPHGIGHLLGIQVHDVAGHVADDKGTPAKPPQGHEWLRLNRTIEAGMVFTIEPGIYFIPVLLDPERSSERGRHLNWPLIDALIPLGGIRIEDNILATEAGPVNLTRQ